MLSQSVGQGEATLRRSSEFPFVDTVIPRDLRFKAPDVHGMLDARMRRRFPLTSDEQQLGVSLRIFRSPAPAGDTSSMGE